MSAIIGILGLQGTGKTMLMTYYAYQEFKRGRTIYSNYHLKGIDYIPVNTLSDIEKMRNGVFLGDELWLWVFSRTSQSKLNKEINKIIMLNRKRDMDIYYTAQRYMSVDVMLRSVTNYFIYPFLKKVNNVWKLGYSIYNEIGLLLVTYVIRKPIEYWGQFYDTTEEISSLNSNKTGIEKGIQLEEKFLNAINKLNFDHVDLLSNSGKDSSWNYDVLAYHKSKCYAFDVKSVCSNRITLKARGHDLNAQIRNAITHGAKPFIGFPNKDNKQITNPKFWFVYPLSYNCYLTSLSSDPFYNKLVKESITLDNILLENNNIVNEC